MKDTTIILDISNTLYFVQDQINLLLLEDIPKALIFELAIDCWNIKTFCSNDETELMIIIDNKINRFLDGCTFEKVKLIMMIKECVEAILRNISNTIVTVIPTNTSYVQFVSIDENKEITILARTEDFSEE